LFNHAGYWSSAWKNVQAATIAFTFNTADQVKAGKQVVRYADS
jgi:hypothetical protein